MNRREARELLFTLVFEYSYKKDCDYAQLYATALEEREFEDDSYVKESFGGIIENLAAIDEKISGKINGWSLTRLTKPTLAICRVAVYEMLYRKDIPFNVSINEAIELSKKYDDEKSPKFINGVLNGIALEGGLKE